MRSRLAVVLLALSIAGCGGGGSTSSTTVVQCPQTQVMCGGLCVDPGADRQHCGATGDCAGASAGTACDPGEVCDAGQCKLSCQAGLLNCGGTCTDPRTDRDHCGASGQCTGGTAQAGVACPSGQLCHDGACVPTCGGSEVVCNGECVDGSLDRTHCGARGDCSGSSPANSAGVICTEGTVCSGGHCQLTCQSALVDCGGTCVDPASDRRYCGADDQCLGGRTCAVGSVCQDGDCVLDCPEGQHACGGRCIDPATDAAYCGATADCTGGATCGAGTACIAGACTPCSATQAACGGACVDPTASHDHCGASGLCTGGQAGVTCRADQVCVGSVCTCPAGTVACGGACVDPRRDASHCGASGTCAGGSAGAVCGAGQVCDQGACAAVQAYDWRPAQLRYRPPHFVEDDTTLAHIVFDPVHLAMTDTKGGTHWTMIGSVPAHENGAWSPSLSWSGPFTAQTKWEGDTATKAWFDANTAADFTVCALYKPGAHPGYGPNKIIIANGKPEGSNLDVGGWALMQMHECSCFHYHDDLFSGCTDLGNGRQWCAAHGEWMSPNCGTIATGAVASLEWTWQCGGRNGAGLGSQREGFSTTELDPMGLQGNGAMGLYHSSAQPPTIGNYADGSAPLWDGGVYEIIISSLPATPENMQNIVARAQGGMGERNEAPVAVVGADGEVHLGAPTTIRIQGDGYVAEDQRVLLTGSIGAAAAGGVCFGYEVAADSWTALPDWLLPFSIAWGGDWAQVQWLGNAAHRMLTSQGLDAMGPPGAAFDPGSHLRELWCFDAADGLARGYANHGTTPFATSATALSPAEFPALDDPLTEVRLMVTDPSVRVYRVWACPGSSPATCW